ncbi:MAG: hypothetical protein R3E54_06735 [Halioglobus sp.]
MKKWRKRYGNFVREVEWALLERQHFNQQQYEEIVDRAPLVVLSYETSGDLKMMNSMSEKKQKQEATESGSAGPTEPAAGSTFCLKPSIPPTG